MADGERSRTTDLAEQRDGDRVATQQSSSMVVPQQGVNIERSTIENFRHTEDNRVTNYTLNFQNVQTSNGNLPQEIFDQISNQRPESKTNLEKVHEYLKKKKLFVFSKFVKGGKLRITSDMLKQTPVAERIRYDQMEDSSVEVRKSTTNIEDVLVNEDDPFETLPIVGVSGSGKTVYALMAFRYYVDKDKIPFLLNVREMNVDEVMRLDFADFISNYFSTDFPLENNTEIAKLLRENEEDCVFIVDGLDQSQMEPFPFGKIQPLHEGKTTAFSWLYRLFEGKVMRTSKVIFTSREASMGKLGIPFVEVYRLKGFTEEGMKQLIKLHDKNVDVEQLNSFIQSKGESFSHFASTPVILSIITWMYKTNKEELEAGSTVSNLYSLTIDKHHRERERQRAKSGQLRPASEAKNWSNIYKKVNKMFYELLNESKYSFTQSELEKHHLSWEDVDSSTMAIAENLDDPENVRYTPTHQSFQEYHSAQHIVKDMDLESFRKFVDEKLFAGHLQDNWKMVQDFVHDLLDKEIDEALTEKKNYFFEAKTKSANVANKAPSATGLAFADEDTGAECPTSRSPVTEPDPDEGFFNEDVDDLEGLDEYKTDNRGTFFIFCFTKDRRGAEMDTMMYQEIAQLLGFKDIRTYEDLTTDEIEDELKKYRVEDHRDDDCVVCAISAHGHPGEQIIVRDGLVKLDHFLKHFNERKCPHLIGKPKLFIIQAQFEEDSENPVCAKETRTNYKDSLLARPGALDIRNVRSGSYYPRYLLEEIRHDSKREICEMLTNVNRRLGEHKFEVRNRYMKMTPFFRSNLTKNLYFH